jgi:hypothetical protein
MTYLNRCLNVTGGDLSQLRRERTEWLSHFRNELPGVVERFYSALGAPAGARWGDKNPHYADPKIDPALLILIDELFPTSQFLHPIRDGRQVVGSLLAKDWTGGVDEAIDSWRRHVEHARSFGTGIGPDRYLEVRFERLVSDGHTEMQGIMTFLGLAYDPALRRFMESQRERPTPFSEPTVKLEQLGREGGDHRLGEHAQFVENALADLLGELGYETLATKASRTRNESPQATATRTESPPLSSRLIALAEKETPARAELTEMARAAEALEDGILAERTRNQQLGAALERARNRYSALLSSRSVRALRGLGRAAGRVLRRRNSSRWADD